MTTSLSSTAPQLRPLALPPAPPVQRESSAPRRYRGPALVLLVVGLLLAVAPVFGGLFSKVASGQQMLDAFAPHITLTALDEYDADLTTLRQGARGVDQVYEQQDIAGAYPGVEQYLAEAAAIDARATDLLATVRASEADYRQVAGIGGFDRVPFLLVATGLAFLYAGGVLYVGRRQTGGALLLAAAASVVLVAYPFLSDLPAGTRAGHRLQDALAPVMTTATVQQQQRDFVVLVHAVGELDTSFADVPTVDPARTDIRALVTAWPTIASDLAELVGTINDNLDNYQALGDLDALGEPLGTSGLVAFGWAPVGAGALTAVAALAASPVRPGRRKEHR